MHRERQELPSHIKASFQKGMWLLGIGMLSMLLFVALIYANTIYHNNILIVLAMVALSGYLIAFFAGIALTIKGSIQVEREGQEKQQASR